MSFFRVCTPLRYLVNVFRPLGPESAEAREKKEKKLGLGKELLRVNNEYINDFVKKLTIYTCTKRGFEKALCAITGVTHQIGFIYRPGRPMGFRRFSYFPFVSYVTENLVPVRHTPRRRHKDYYEGTQLGPRGKTDI